MKVGIINNGCVKEKCMQRNLLAKLEENNIEKADNLENTDYLIYITCGGTGDAIEKELKDIKTLNYYSQFNNIKIIVVGCLLIDHTYLFEDLAKNPSFKLITNKEWVIPTINYINDMKKRNTLKDKLLNRTYYFDSNGIAIQFLLQKGCNNKCTFCKVHYMNNGPSSFPFELALEHLTNMIKRGTKIISLGGENLTQYGIDLYNKKRIHEFIHELSKVEGLEMINVLELVPGDMYPELLDEIINNPKVVSTSFQIETASDRLLKLMNRNYNLEQYDYYAKIIREHNKSITTLLIGGFPTETEEDMNCTLNYLMDRKIIVAGVCPYSDFEYIPSHKLEQLTKSEIRKHTYHFVKAIREINKRIYLEELLKQNKHIYFESVNNQHYFYPSIPTIITTSNSNIYENLNPGDIITSTPKRLVKRDKMGKEFFYKL